MLKTYIKPIKSCGPNVNNIKTSCVSRLTLERMIFRPKSIICPSKISFFLKNLMLVQHESLWVLWRVKGWVYMGVVGWIRLEEVTNRLNLLFKDHQTFSVIFSNVWCTSYYTTVLRFSSNVCWSTREHSVVHRRTFGHEVKVKIDIWFFLKKIYIIF